MRLCFLVLSLLGAGCVLPSWEGVKFQCEDTTECAAGYTCSEGLCRADTCANATTDGDETDLDCGGSCPACALEKACTIAPDCRSGSCVEGACVRVETPSTCENEATDGDETDRNCGGSCAACGVGKRCLASGDCRSARCVDGACATACVTPRCEDLGAECGVISDSCGNQVECGNCVLPKTCGAAGIANRCGCVPDNVASCVGRCGRIRNNCGAEIECGTTSCTGSQVCGTGVEATHCCVPETCAVAGVLCGPATDGCTGATLDCGDCAAPRPTGPPHWVSTSRSDAYPERAVAAPLPDGRAVFAFGGGAEGKVYDPENESWTALALPSVVDDNAFLVPIPGDWLLFGGGPFQPAYVWRFAPGRTTTQLTFALSLVTNRVSTALALPSGQVLHIGAEESGGGEVVSAAIFNPASDSWRRVAAYPAGDGARLHPAAFLGPDGLAYFTGGGTNAFPPVPSAQTWRYQPGLDTWTAGVALPSPRLQPAGTTGPDGRAYVAGGASAPGVFLTDVVAFNFGRNTWENVSPLPEGRAGAGFATLADGRLLLSGGARPGQPPQADAWLYGPMPGVSPRVAAAGGTLTLGGSNFAGDATVMAYWDTVERGHLLGTGRSDSAGTLVSTFNVRVPADATPGRHRILFVDAKARYPVWVSLLVP